EEADVVGDDLGGVALVAVLVFPGARLDAPLDVGLAPLAQVLATQLAELSPGDDAVPLGALLLLPALVGPALARRQTELAHRVAARDVAQLGIGAEVSDQDDLVHTTSHGA